MTVMGEDLCVDIRKDGITIEGSQLLQLESKVAQE